MNDELSIKLFKELENNPEQSQRSILRNCSMSLGSANYCLRELIKKGYVKAKNFKNAQNKLVYAYILTPSGINHKKELTISFLKRKQTEYEILEKRDSFVKTKP